MRRQPGKKRSRKGIVWSSVMKGIESFSLTKPSRARAAIEKLPNRSARQTAGCARIPRSIPREASAWWSCPRRCGQKAADRSARNLQVEAPQGRLAIVLFDRPSAAMIMSFNCPLRSAGRIDPRSREQFVFKYPASSGSV